MQGYTPTWVVWKGGSYSIKYTCMGPIKPVRDLLMSKVPGMPTNGGNLILNKVSGPGCDTNCWWLQTYIV